MPTDDIQARILVGWKESLIKPFFVEEIKKALFPIKGNKAPGPDGYNAAFYQNIGTLWVLILSELFNHFFSRTIAKEVE